MNWKRYLQDKRVEILIFMVGVIIEAVFLAACQVETELFLLDVKNMLLLVDQMVEMVAKVEISILLLILIVIL